MTEGKSESALTVRLTTLPEAVVLAVAGDLDLGSAQVLRTRAREALADGPPALILDLGGITFCGSAGLQVIAELATGTTAAGLPFAVVADGNPVLRAIELAHLDSKVGVHPTVDDAGAWVRKRHGR